MSKIGTLLSVILTILNWISLTLIIYLTTMKSTVENNLTKVNQLLKKVIVANLFVMFFMIVVFYLVVDALEKSENMVLDIVVYLYYL